MAIQMTDKKLKKDLNRYFRLAKKNFPLRYNSERIEIEDRAFEILNLFERGCLNISGQDYAAWADYILTHTVYSDYNKQFVTEGPYA